MPHTLVTGANSFVGVHVVKALVEAGHTVTGSVRRAAAGEDVIAEHPEWKQKVDFVEVPDYAAPHAWDTVFRGREFDYIVHVASPMFGDEKNTDYDRDWLRPAVDGYATGVPNQRRVWLTRSETVNFPSSSLRNSLQRL